MTNWGIYITFISTILQLACALRYRKCLNNFKIQLRNTTQIGGTSCGNVSFKLMQSIMEASVRELD